MPDNSLKYSKEHEWVRTDGNKAYIGITDFAQKALGSIVFVELPEVGSHIGAGDVLGAVESVKAASDIYSPVTGTVAEVNESLSDSPESINENADQCWIAVIEMENLGELDELMDREAYDRFCSKEA